MIAMINTILIMIIMIMIIIICLWQIHALAETYRSAAPPTLQKSVEKLKTRPPPPPRSPRKIKKIATRPVSGSLMSSIWPP